MIWREARAAADFAMLRPALEEVVRLTREEAAAKAAALGLRALRRAARRLRAGPGTAEIDALFEPLAAFLPDFLERVLARQAEPLPLEGPLPGGRAEGARRAADGARSASTSTTAASTRARIRSAAACPTTSA